MRVVLHIDRVLLRGVARGDAGPLVAGLRAELRSLLGGAGGVEALSRHNGTASVAAGTVRMVEGRGSEAAGREVAGRIVRGGRQ